LTVNIDAEFEEVTLYHFHLNLTVSAQLFRRTGGNIFLGWSDRAIMDFYFTHGISPFRWFNQEKALSQQARICNGCL